MSATGDLRARVVYLIALCIAASLLLPLVRGDEGYNVIATLQAPEPTDFGGFGADLALHGGLLLVAEWEADLGELTKVGRAYIYDSDWNLVKSLQAPDPENYETFSISVDLWEDTLAISCYDNVDDIEEAGIVYIYDTEGTFQKLIQSPEPEFQALFGEQLCLYGDLLLVAEPAKNVEGTIDAGLVHVFDSEGAYQRTLVSPSKVQSGGYGGSIDTNDEFILVGECGVGSKPISESSVYVYDRDYNHITTLHPSDNQERSFFGYSVAISENHLVISERWATVDGLERAGRAHIYDTDWNLVATLQSPTPEENGEFGIDAHIEGGLVVVGERKGDVEIMNEGRAHVFDLKGNLVDTLVSPEPEVGAQFGWRVLTDGEIVLVADVEHTADGFSKAGQVHIFEWGEQTAEQPQKAEGETAESEPEPEPEKSGGIPGFPLVSILVSLASVIAVLWLTQRRR